MSILKTIPITLDLKRVGAQSQALPTLVEGDNGNVFVITMTDDGTPLDLSTATRVICVFSKTSDGRTVEQDTEDANVALEDYGITVTGTPAANDTITVVKSSGTYTVTISSLGITDASVTDTGAFDDKFPDDGTYVFTYSGTSWMYGTHSVTISGADNNIVTVHLKSASYGAGTNNCEVQIYSGTDGDVLVTSANFNFKGRKGIMNDETLLSEEKYPILVSLITAVTTALNLARPFTNVSASASTLAPGSPASASVTVGSDSATFAFGIPDADGIASVSLISGSHQPGTYDTYRILMDTGWYYDFQVWNGKDGVQSPYDSNPEALGTADPGTSNLYARGDHVHPMPSNTDVDVAYKIYNSVSDLELTVGSATISGAWGAMPDNSMLICDAGEFANTEVATTIGTIVIVRRFNYRGSIVLYGKKTADSDYRMFINDSNVPDGTWHLIHDNNDILYFTSVTCSAMTGNFASVSDSRITGNHVVAECSFAHPHYVNSGVTWSTSGGSLTLNGTCNTATAAHIVLVKKDN